MNDFPEAPASVTYTVMRNGFNMLFTVRSTAGVTLLDQMDAIEKKLIDKGYEPQPVRTFGGGYAKKEPEYVPNRVCPTCGEKLIYATKKGGTKYIKCSTNKWDKIKNMATGCPYVQWDIEEEDPTDKWKK